jgi:hypothetical protein
MVCLVADSVIIISVNKSSSLSSVVNQQYSLSGFGCTVRYSDICSSFPDKFCNRVVTESKDGVNTEIKFVRGYKFYCRLVFCVLIFPVVCPYISYVLEILVTHLSFLAGHFLL